MWAGLVVEPIKSWGVEWPGTSNSFSSANTYATQLHNSTSTLNVLAQVQPQAI